MRVKDMCSHSRLHFSSILFEGEVCMLGILWCLFARWMGFFCVHLSLFQSKRSTLPDFGGRKSPVKNYWNFLAWSRWHCLKELSFFCLFHLMNLSILIYSTLPPQNRSTVYHADKSHDSLSFLFCNGIVSEKRNRLKTWVFSSLASECMEKQKQPKKSSNSEWGLSAKLTISFLFCKGDSQFWQITNELWNLDFKKMRVRTWEQVWLRINFKVVKADIHSVGCLSWCLVFSFCPLLLLPYLVLLSWNFDCEEMRG